MKIAFIHYHQTTQIRGVETYIQEISKRLGKHHQVNIFSHPNPVIQSRSKLSLLQRLFLDKLSLNIAHWTFSELKKLNSFDPDVIIVLNSGWQVLILRLWTQLKRKKLFVPGQSGPGWDDRWNLFCNPDVFICLTQRQLNWAKEAFHWPWQKFVIIPNGVDLEKFTPQGPKAKLSLKRPLVLLIGAAEPNKRVEQGIRAVSELKNTSLLWIGAGPLTQELEKLGNQLLGKEHFLHLSVPFSDIPKYYRSADLFTLCSASSEAFGIVYLEALASGLPVVATNDQSRREIISDAGLYVDNPDDPLEYSQKIKTALSSTWGNKPRLRAKLFDWDGLYLKYENLLRRSGQK